MQSNWRIGEFFGIPIYINSSWFLILAFVTLLNATDGGLQELIGYSSYRAWSIGFLLALLLFISVLLHELGHSTVARLQGIEVRSITLFLFGGIAEIERESRNPKDALAVAIAGPLVSVSIFALLSLLNLIPAPSPVIGYILTNIASINLFLALFNLIPGLPLDGGQILKAILWKISGDRLVAVRRAANSGKIIGWGCIVFAAISVLLTGDVSGAWLGLIGWFIIGNATAYARLTDLQESLLTITAGEVMTRDLKILDAERSLDDFARDYITHANKTPIVFFAASEGRYRGLIRVEDLQSIERGSWQEKTLASIAIPLADLVSVGVKSPLLEAVLKLKEGERFITVLSPALAVEGVIDRVSIVKTIAARYNIPLHPAEIERVRNEAIYPPYLPLETIAMALDRKEPPKISDPLPIV